MSTTFEIYPRTTVIPTFAQVVELTTTEFERRLRQLDIRPSTRLTSTIRSADEANVLIPDTNGKFVWPADTYLWFGIQGVDGGTDGYYESTDELTREVWNDYFALPQFVRRKDFALECLSVGHYWTFRRSAGQLGVTNLLYGILSGCVAKLTDGLVMSGDSAWEWNKMPYTADEFLDQYFVAERTDDPEYRDLTARCLSGIAEDLSR